ncbi:DNA-directed RNA polymerase subunit beta [Halalkalibacter kiskunsagensis]|uniref:DNA-directed RNA polymerase subunit beta n=1 Tax=Halalkalibacter kiskunsagensis TaxID=1548599 RepID=A0ABV6KFM1_9BACI
MDNGSNKRSQKIESELNEETNSRADEDMRENDSVDQLEETDVLEETLDEPTETEPTGSKTLEADRAEEEDSLSDETRVEERPFTNEEGELHEEASLTEEEESSLTPNEEKTEVAQADEQSVIHANEEGTRSDVQEIKQGDASALIAKPAEQQEETKESKETREARRKKRTHKPRLRLIPIWLRIFIAIVLIGGSLILGLMFGFGVIGGHDPAEVIRPETWYHIIDFIRGET